MTTGDEQTTSKTGVFGLPHMLYQTQYAWLLFFAALDVILTSTILRFGGEEGIDPSLEVNPIARLVIESWGMVGAMLFKFSLVMLAIVLCEVVGRAKPRTGARLALASIIILAIPVVWSLFLFVREADHLFG